MTSKTKKITLLTAGIAGTLLASSVAAVTLSACTFQVVNPNGGSSTTESTNPQVQYNIEINWNDNSNAEDWVIGEPLPVSKLVIDDQGLVYANSAKTELIGTVPNFSRIEITIPASVQLISGYVNVVKTTASGGQTTTTKTHTPAFKNNTSLRIVKFASGSQLKTIGANVFQDAVNLETVDLPSSVKLINNSAFEGTSNLSNINLDNITVFGNSAFKNSFTSANSTNVTINIKNAVTIGDSAFEGVTNLKAINFSDSPKLTKIGNSAFKNAVLAKTFDLSSAKYLRTIGNSAFEGTTAVDTVILPVNLKTIGTSIFKNSSITNLDLTNTLVTAIPESAFEGALNLASVKLNDQTTTLGNRSFSLTPKLETISLPSTVSAINQAFQGNNGNINNPGIKELDLSNTQVTSIETAAFDGNNNLQKVILNDKITSIKSQAFRNNTSLTTMGPTGTPEGSLVLPSSVTQVEGYSLENNAYTSVDLSQTQITSITNAVFFNNKTITSIKYPNTLTTLGNDIDYGSTNLNAITSLDLSNTKVTTINNNAFINSQLQSIILPNTLTTIGNSAFKNNKNLTSITVAADPETPSTKASNFKASFPSSLTTINNSAFVGTALESIDLSNTKITEIKDNTFGECEQLTTVVIPDNVTTLGQRIFATTEADSKYNVDQGVISNAKLTTFGTKSDLGISDTSTTPTNNKVILPQSITNIANNTFEYSGIVDIDLSKITSFKTTGTDNEKYGLSAWAFNGNTQLKTVVLPNWIKGTIGGSAFRTTKSLMSVTVAGNNSATTYDDAAAGTFDISTSNISGFADGNQFKGSNLGTFKFPVDFDRNAIPTSAFENTKISEVKVQNTTATDGAQYAILGETTSSIGANAFSNNKTLKTVELPATITSSVANAFKNIDPTATITYPQGVIITGQTDTTTATNAFANDPFVTELDLSESSNLTTLAAGTFNNATKLSKIVLPAKAVQWQLNATNNGGNPLYNNAKELNIEFTMFTKSDGNAPTDFNDINTSNEVKQQIANIMNMFSYYAPTQGIHPVQYSNWTARVGSDAQNSWITEDLTKDNVFSAWSKDGNSSDLAEDKSGATKNHNGLTWTYNKATAKTAGDITITSNNLINIYRTISTASGSSQWDSADTNGGKFQPNQGKQTYFSTPQTNANGAPDPAVKVTVTMRIVTKTN